MERPRAGSQGITAPIFSSSSIYTDGAYWRQRMDADSSYKVALVEELLAAVSYEFPRELRAVEIGCGQGAFLIPLSRYLRDRGVIAQLDGWDIAAEAIAVAESRTQGLGIQFHLGSYTDLPDRYDFIFCMDVLEHVENPFDLLRHLAGKSRYVLLHLPIEHSVAHLLLRRPTLSASLFRHVHFYSWETARLLLADLPFIIAGHQFTAASKRTPNEGSPILRALRIVRRHAYGRLPSLAPALLGGPVLLLLENSSSAVV